MRAVKIAEQILVDQQESKKYIGAEGDNEFLDLLKPIIFGENERQNIVGIQTPGGSGALRLGSELIKKANVGVKVFLGLPTWINHAAIFISAALSVQTYSFVDLAKQEINFESVIDALMRAKKGDVVLLHGCCHNPTGIDFTKSQWKTVAELLASQNLVPFIDLAYQGLGHGLEEDAHPTRTILEAVDEALVAYSCNKNFGLYRDRVGALYVVAKNARDAATSQSNLAALARVNWSMPPDHGAAVVRTILQSSNLTEMWHLELAEMRQRIRSNREALARTTPELSFLKKQHGLFSNLAVSQAKASALRENHAIYIADSGRLNLAGMQTEEIQKISRALVAESCLLRDGLLS